MEANFYATDVTLAPIAASVGEIKNIQVESSFDQENETLNAGDSVIYRNRRFIIMGYSNAHAGTIAIPIPQQLLYRG